MATEIADWPSIHAGSDHSPPTAAVPTTATASAICSAASDSATPAASFAASTRERSGTSANVSIAVRCDHSELTSRMPTIGSRMLAGASASAEEVAQRCGRRRLAEDREQGDDGDRERGGREQQPEAGARVGHLAQLDAGQPREARPRVAGAGAAR